MRSSRRAVLRFALGIALAVAVFVEILPRIASYGSVAHRLGTISAPWIAALAVGSLLDIVTTALPWMAVLPQLSFPGALAFTQASTALTTVLPGGAPLGMALSFGFLRRLRVDRASAAFAVAVTGIWSQVMILVYPLVGAILVFATGNLSTSTAVIAAVSAAGGAVIVGTDGGGAAQRGSGPLARRPRGPGRGLGRRPLSPSRSGLERRGTRETAGGVARGASPALAAVDRCHARQPADCLPRVRALPAGGGDLSRQPAAERGVPRVGDRARAQLLAAHTRRESESWSWG